jgi:hypothetical protein
MNQIRIAFAVLFLLFATSASAVAWSQEPQPQQQEEPKAKPDKEIPHQKDAKPPKQDESKSAKQEKQDESKTAKQEKQEKDNAKKDEQSQQGHNSSTGKGGRIPDDKFRASFGRQHTFSVGHVETAGGRPHFQYSGYSFEIVDPWPVGWAYTDDCYIDFIDGEYFIFDVFHPGVRIALVIL